MNPTATETLTLITCVPVGVYSHRLIVRALPAP
jgi:sortase (surface protein transpeptidase)